MIRTKLANVLVHGGDLVFLFNGGWSVSITNPGVNILGKNGLVAPLSGCK